MKQINLGSTGLKVPQVALGCMRMSGLSKKEAADVIQTSIEQEINFFDHADIYGAGQAEIIFGEAIKELGLNREELIIQSKCGIRDGFYDFSKENISLIVWKVV